MSKRLLAISLFALALGWTWWLSRETDSGRTGPGPDRQASGRIDYYLEELEVVAMSKEGVPMRSLKATHLSHDSVDDTTQLRSPQLQVFEPDSPRWEVQAEQGLVSGDGKLVLLSGGVEVRREATASHEPLELLTQRLRVRPEEDFAETDDPVTITRGPDRVDAVGMQAWMRKPVRIKLLAEAKGHYVPR